VRVAPDELVGDVFDGIGNREMARLGLELGQKDRLERRYGEAA